MAELKREKERAEEEQRIRNRLIYIRPDIPLIYIQFVSPLVELLI